MCIYTQKCFNRIPIFPLRVFPWNLYSNKNKTFSPAKKYQLNEFKARNVLTTSISMNILSGQIRENQGLNAKGWDRAHTSRDGLWLVGLVRERLLWNLRLSPVWDGGFREAGGNTLPPEGWCSVPGLSPWMKQPWSDTQLRHLSPRKPGQVPWRLQVPRSSSVSRGDQAFHHWAVRIESEFILVTPAAISAF